MIGNAINNQSEALTTDSVAGSQTSKMVCPSIPLKRRSFKLWGLLRDGSVARLTKKVKKMRFQVNSL